VGDAPGTLTPRELADTVRVRIGEHGEAFGHTCDIIVAEICRCWPMDEMADIAAHLKDSQTADRFLNAFNVINAKVRENIEARWGCKKSNRIALGIVLKACVVETCNLWFLSPEMRIAMRPVIEAVRRGAPIA